MFNLKYRPKNFNEMIGNELITREMKKHSINFTYPQVMILEGLSGSGKTTSAKIISKTINCLQPTLASKGEHIPCDVCPSCKAINIESYNRNTTLFDSTLTSGKEDINKLKSLVSKAPIFDKNKIIIIEECHNLSKSAMESLLTLTEKPRKKVFFILCTTEVNKLPLTLKRRGQKYTFKGLSSLDLYDLGETILKREGLFETIPDSFFIGENDKQSVLDVIISYSKKSAGVFVSDLQRCVKGEIFTFNEVEEAFNYYSDDKFDDIISDIVYKNVSGLITLNNLKDYDVFLKRFKGILSNILVYQVTKDIPAYFKVFSDILIASNFNLIELAELLMSIPSYPVIDRNSLILNVVKYYKSENTTQKKVRKIRDINK